MYEQKGEEKRIRRPPTLHCGRTSLPEIHAHSLAPSTNRGGVPPQRSSIHNRRLLKERSVLMTRKFTFFALLLLLFFFLYNCST